MGGLPFTKMPRRGKRLGCVGGLPRLQCDDDNAHTVTCDSEHAIPILQALFKTFAEFCAAGWITAEEKRQLKALVVSANEHTLAVLCAALAVQCEDISDGHELVDTLRIVLQYKTLM